MVPSQNVFELIILRKKFVLPTIGHRAHPYLPQTWSSIIFFNIKLIILTFDFNIVIHDGCDRDNLSHWARRTKIFTLSGTVSQPKLSVRQEHLPSTPEYKLLKFVAVFTITGFAIISSICSPEIDIL